MTGTGRRPDDELVQVAEVVRPVGLRGEVKLYPLLDFHPLLLDSGFLRWDDGKPAEFRTVRDGGSGTWIVHPAECEDRTAAEQRVGRGLVFRTGDYRRPEFPRPAGGLPFRYLGRSVVTAGGEPVGEVVEVRRHGAQYTLVVADEGGEMLIPAVQPILRPDGDALEGDLVVDPPEGLLDANR
ncbi:MAG: hypothetical protein R6X25_14340 [Candidatus Krumholzibacteriia bacterium]